MSKLFSWLRRLIVPKNQKMTEEERRIITLMITNFASEEFKTRWLKQEWYFTGGVVEIHETATNFVVVDQETRGVLFFGSNWMVCKDWAEYNGLTVANGEKAKP